MIFIADLNRNQERFLLALATNDTIEKASEQAGIARSTAYKYLKDETFKEARKRMRRGTMEVVNGRVQHEALESVNVLAEIRDDPEAPTHTRVQASKVLLETAYKAHELEDVIERIEELEESERLRIEKGGKA